MKIIKRLIRKIFKPKTIIDNLRTYIEPEFTPEKIQNNLDYALKIASNYLAMVGGPEAIKNKNVMEIGPGPDIGTSLFLSFHGAKIFIVDRFLPEWNEKYHPQFYALLRKWAVENLPSADLSVLDAVIKSKGYPEHTVTVRRDFLENINLPDNTVDFVFSNAVFEHLVDAGKGIAQLARVSRHGSMGFHQIDMRFHHDFSRPLDYLLLEDEEFKSKYEVHHSGSPRRQFEYAEHFKNAGVEIIEFKANLQIDESYLKEITEKLRKSKSKYKDLSEEQLRIISGHFTVKKM